MDHEQHINMKFCFKLQKSAKETPEMLKLFYGMLQWPWRQFTSVSSDFIMVVNQLKMKRNQDILQHQKPMRMLKE